MSTTPKPNQPRGLSALLCACYNTSRKNRPQNSTTPNLNGDVTYARINKSRVRSQMPLTTQLWQSTMSEIDIDEISGYATILKPPIQPRKGTAQDLLITEKTYFPARVSLTLPRQMSLGSDDAGDPRAVVNITKPVVMVPEPVKVEMASEFGKTVMMIPENKTSGMSKSTSFSSKKNITKRASLTAKPVTDKSIPSGIKQPLTISTLPRPGRSTYIPQAPSIATIPTKLPTTLKSTSIPAIPSTSVSQLRTLEGFPNVKNKSPAKAALKISTSAAPHTKKTTVSPPKSATKIATFSAPSKSSILMKNPSPPKQSFSIKTPSHPKVSALSTTLFPSKPANTVVALTQSKPATPLFTLSKPSPPSTEPSPPSSIYNQPISNGKSLISRHSSEDISNTISNTAAALDNVAMIATVYPYNRDNSSSGFKIEDVTDDPKYRDDENAEREGVLVEYCRIDQREQKPAHSVCEAAITVSARGINNNDKLSSFTPSTLTAKKSSIGSTVGTPRMTNIIDIDVGSVCSALNQCKCNGFRPHPWRKVCVHCKCDRSEHEIGTNKVLSVYERLGIKPTDEMTAVMKTANRDTPGSVSHGYAWVPPGLTRVKVEEFFSQYPNHVIPRTNSLGEKYREKQLMIQLPRQDLSIAYCKHLRTPVEHRIYEEFVNARNEISLDIGFVCPSLPRSAECKKCRGVLEKGDIAVTASKMGDDAVWHPACFICATCEQLLVDLTYCTREDKIFCERHYAELHKPRCSACDELIFAGEYTKAMNKDWHSDHFCCWNCDATLTGQRYILRDDHPFCIKCYEDVFANTCDECTKPIGIDSKDLSYKDKHWHEDCFLCNMCKISLVDKPFGSKNDRIFCSNCYDNAFATRCDGCNEIFRAGMKKMEYKGKQWHDKCFCCATCKVPIGTKSFIPKNEEVYCATCYEDKFATRCIKCKKVISSGGVTYKNEPWHRECFCCTNCGTSLTGQRFTSKDDKPYCAHCYGDLFAKRCNACVKPITGIGGAKFISFEDRHWHNDCFICAQCTTSLVGKGFITDSADILCPECAKARLMAAHS